MPATNPQTAPMTPPPSRPSETTTTERKSGVEPSVLRKEKKETCRITATTRISAMRIAIRQVTIIGRSHPLSSLRHPRSLRDAREDLYELQVGHVREGLEADPLGLAGLGRADAGDLADGQ